MMLFMSGCIEKKSTLIQNEKDALREYFIYNMGLFPKDLAMLEGESVRQQDLLITLFEGLVKSSGVSEEVGIDTIVPGIAESWNISKDELCYSFKIRDNAYWNDGTEITSKDFVDFFSYILSPSVNNVYDYQLYYVCGAKDYRNGKITFENVAIKAPNKKVLEIRLNYPCSYFLKILSEPVYCLRNFNDNLINWETDFKNIHYSGAFKIASMNIGENITLEKNEKYWNTSEVKSNKIMLTSIESSEKCLAKFKTCELDMFENPPISEIEELINEQKVKLIPSHSGAGIAFNLKGSSAVKDITIRKAVATCINKSEIAEKALNDTVIPASKYIPSSITGYNSYKGNELEKHFSNVFDVKGNIKNKLEVNTLKFVFLDSTENRRICSSIADSIHDTVGINIKLIGCSKEELKETIDNGNYDMIKIDYGGEYDSPIAFLEKWITNSKFNVYGYSNSSYDRLINQTKNEKDNKKKMLLIEKAEDTLVNDVPVIPLYYYNTVLCKRGNIEGIYITKRGNVVLNKAYVTLPQ